MTKSSPSDEKPDISATFRGASRDHSPDERRLPKTLKEAIIRATEYLYTRNSPSPRLDAETLIAHVLKYRRLDLYLNHDSPLSEEEYNTIVDPILRRGSGVPVAYITGVKEFYSLNFIVNESVLIPRPETEFLVSEALMYIRMKKLSTPDILEIGTGSGAIAVSLASSIEDGDITATDISENALEVMKKNCERHDTFDLVTPIPGDLYEPVPGRAFDLIISNPPYLSDNEMETLPVEVKSEPRLALAGGSHGLDVISPLIAGASEHLNQDGCLIIEIGATQKDQVVDLVDKADHLKLCHVRQDYAGLPRVVVARKV
jgi:release factor glutamine methyltransferase